MEYTAKITHKDGHWLVAFPDCHGCQTFGDSKVEAIKMAHEALEGWLEAHLLHGGVPPRPRAHRGVAIAVRPRLDVAIQIRWLRDVYNVTQGELAKRVGVSQQQIAKLENPDANPTIGTLDAFASKADARLTVTISPARTLRAKPKRRDDPCGRRR